MNADASNVAEGLMVLINTSNTSDEDNAKLYVKTSAGFSFIVDLSGAKGIQGERGPAGPQGLKGEKGDLLKPTFSIDESGNLWVEYADE